MRDQQPQRPRKNRVELAVELLKKEYLHRLSTDEFLDIVDLIENEAKASVFLSLPGIAIRDIWLQKQVNINLVFDISNTEL